MCSTEKSVNSIIVGFLVVMVYLLNLENSEMKLAAENSKTCKMT
jgi:hypothetical protein